MSLLTNTLSCYPGLKNPVYLSSEHRRLACRGTGGLVLVCMAAFLSLLGCDQKETSHPKQVIVLGIDGMDYGLSAKMLE